MFTKKNLFAFSLTICFAFVSFSCSPDNTAEEDSLYEQNIDRTKIKVPTNGIDRTKIKVPTNG